MEVRLSSKSQIVIPKEVRERLGLRPGDKVRLQILEGKRALIQPATRAPKEVFAVAGRSVVEAALDEARRVDEEKIRKLLSSLGVPD